jgi:hypothetical protein
VQIGLHVRKGYIDTNTEHLLSVMNSKDNWVIWLVISLNRYYSTFFVPVPPDVISLQLYTAEVAGV